jgi:hypothetical protein
VRARGEKGTDGAGAFSAKKKKRKKPWRFLTLSLSHTTQARGESNTHTLRAVTIKQLYDVRVWVGRECVWVASLCEQRYAPALERRFLFFERALFSHGLSLSLHNNRPPPATPTWTTSSSSTARPFTT